MLDRLLLACIIASFLLLLGAAAMLVLRPNHLLHHAHTGVEKSAERSLLAPGSTGS